MALAAPKTANTAQAKLPRMKLASSPFPKPKK
jgi:hypothetical protein